MNLLLNNILSAIVYQRTSNEPHARPHLRCSWLWTNLEWASCETMFGVQLAINEPRMNLLRDHIWGVIAY